MPYHSCCVPFAPCVGRPINLTHGLAHVVQRPLPTGLLQQAVLKQHGQRGREGRGRLMFFQAVMP